MNSLRSLQLRLGRSRFRHNASKASPAAILILALGACSSPPRQSPAPLEAGRPVSPPLVSRLRVPMLAASSPTSLPEPLRASPLIPAEAATLALRSPPAAASSAAAANPPAIAQPPVLSESAAVAARFPQPAVNYALAALAADRTEFTSQAELQSLLRGWVRDGASSPGGSTVRLLSVGVSQAGIPIEGLLFTRSRDASPEGLLADKRPTVVLVGQQHGDEPAAGEALLVIAEQLARGPLQPLIDRINVVLVPRANPDAVRRNLAATAAGTDLDRDHLLLQTPEARALAQLVRNYRAMVVLDLHEYPVGGPYVDKFGAVQRFDALLQYAMTGNLPEFVTRAAEEWFRQPLVAAFARERLSSEWFHSTSAEREDRKLSMGSSRPDSLRNASGLKSAVSLVVESRGAGSGRTHLLRRVHTQVVAASSVLNSAAQRASDLLKLRQYVDADIAAQACRGQVALDARPTPSEYSVLMLDPLTGADRPVTVAWDSALALVPSKTRSRPCGYWIAADQTETVQRLRELGLAVAQVAEAGAMRGESYREALPERASAESGRELRAVMLSPGAIEVAPGSYYLPLGQPLANLAIAILEPDTPYSYHANGIVSRLQAVARVTGTPDPRLFAAP